MVIPAIARIIERKPLSDIFSFKKKYPNIAKNIVWVLIINTTLATVVVVIAKTYATKLNDKKKPPNIAGNPESLIILIVFFDNEYLIPKVFNLYK